MLKTKYKNLKDIYRRKKGEKNKGLPSGSASASTSSSIKREWEYFPIMDQFLAPFISSKK